MTIGLDTNILVRYLTDDDPIQADKVEKFFKSQSENSLFIINNVVLAELDWVLTSVYNYDREDFIKVINQLLETERITFQTPSLVEKACLIYTKSDADFSDCYIGILNNDMGSKTTITFDKKASNLDYFSLLQ